MDPAALWTTLTTPYEVGALSVSVLTVVLLVVLTAATLLLASTVARLARDGAQRMGVEEPLARRLARWLWVLLVILGLGAAVHFSGLITMRKALLEAQQAANFELVVLSGTPVTPATLVSFGLILLVAWWVSQLLQGLVRRTFSRRKGEADATVLVVNRFLHYGVLVVAAVVGLETLGINLSALLAAGAVFAVGLGLALQNLARNFLSGLILLAERSVRPGDVLEVEGRLVKVVETRIRSTIARTLDEEELILPNDVLVEGSIVNHTLTDTLFRVRAKVGVAYESDLDQVVEALHQAGALVDTRVKHQEPAVLLVEFGSSSIDFELSVWIDDPWHMRQLRSELLLAIWRTFRERQITIAFPQVDVHLDAPVEQGILSLAGGQRG